MYYGQKRGGKSGLIPFPRVGRGGANTWDLGDSEERVHPRYDGEEMEFATVPSKRQSLIPFPRVGKRASSDYHRRILRSQSHWPKRDDFKRRITKKSSWGKSSKAFDRRILRSTAAYGNNGGEFKRRITRSWDEATRAPELAVRKRQSLIPFPRTGKRSGSTESSNRELNQVYIYDSPDDQDEDDDPEAEPEPEPREDEGDFDVIINDDDLVFEDDLDDESLGLPYNSVGRPLRISRGIPGSFYQEY